ncbi:hypothetical protein HAX54_028398, partial [Datura stramonium]|nr:hypothetical protein [Datura stramonium]
RGRSGGRFLLVARGAGHGGFGFGCSRWKGEDVEETGAVCFPAGSGPKGKRRKIGWCSGKGRRREEECGAAVAVDGISLETSKRRRREWRWSCDSNGLCRKWGKRVVVRLSFGWRRGLSVKREAEGGVSW